MYKTLHENFINNLIKDKGNTINALVKVFGPNLSKKEIKAIVDCILISFGEQSLLEK